MEHEMQLTNMEALEMEMQARQEMGLQQLGMVPGGMMLAAPPGMGAPMMGPMGPFVGPPQHPMGGQGEVFYM